MAAVCGEDGEWRPNPGDVECRKNDTLSTGKAYIGVFVCELAMPRNIIGASLSEPHLVSSTAALSIYLFIYIYPTTSYVVHT